jgi:glycosyltransferase involved in cell wall biosynthesis
VKIAFVYDSIYPYVIGGGEKGFWEVATRMARRGGEVYLIGMKYWDGPAEIERDGVKIRGICGAVPMYDDRGNRRLIEACYFGWHVLLHLLTAEYDVINCACFPYFSCLAASAASVIKREKLVITWFEVLGKAYWDEHMGRAGMWAFAVEKAVSRCTRWHIAISDFTRERAIAELGMSPSKVVTIPFGISYADLRPICGVAKEEQILYAGRLATHKRLDLLIHAFACLKHRHPGYRLKLIGSGPEERSLHQMVNSMGLQQDVLFETKLEERELYAEISRSKLFVLPSEREGQGLVIIEAMALGTPVVANDSRYSAVGSIISPGLNGMLVRSVDEMVEAMDRLLSDAALFDNLIRGGYECAAKYDWDEAVVPALDRVFSEILCASKRSA